MLEKVYLNAARFLDHNEQYHRWRKMILSMGAKKIALVHALPAIFRETHCVLPVCNHGEIGVGIIKTLRGAEQLSVEKDSLCSRSSVIQTSIIRTLDYLN